MFAVASWCSVLEHSSEANLIKYRYDIFTASRTANETGGTAAGGIIHSIHRIYRAISRSNLTVKEAFHTADLDSCSGLIRVGYYLVLILLFSHILLTVVSETYHPISIPKRFRLKVPQPQME